MGQYKRELLLGALVEEVKKDPDFFMDVVRASQMGLIEQAKEAQLRAADFETATASLLEYVGKGCRHRARLMKLVMDKLANWAGKTQVNWSVFQNHINIWREKPEKEVANG